MNLPEAHCLREVHWSQPDRPSVPIGFLFDCFYSPVIARSAVAKRAPAHSADSACDEAIYGMDEKVRRLAKRLLRALRALAMTTAE